MKNVDPSKLDAFLGKMVTEMSAAAGGALVLLGDRLGLYRSLVEHGPIDADGLATKTNLDSRYLLEWLSAQAAGGYVDYEPSSGQFSLNPEQQAVFADPDSPVALSGGFYGIASMYIDEEKIAEAFKTSEGVGWGDHHSCLFCGTEKFFRPGYAAHLVAEWLPSLDGILARLEQGARVADVGCGHGCSTTIMAQAFPNSEFIGFDIHGPSIQRARVLAEQQGISNVHFDTATAKDFPGENYDLVTFFDCLHDMGDPVGASTHVLNSLSNDGSWMIVEPFAGDNLSENLNPVGRMYYSFSTMICTPASKSQEVGLALGAQAGEKRLGEVVKQGGFTRFRRANETPFNLILEAKP